MKITKQEVEENLASLLNEPYKCDIYIGTESDGDVVVVAVVDSYEHEFIQAFSLTVVKLAKKHGETYRPYVFREKFFETYKAYNGFVEVEKEPEGDVAKERWEWFSGIGKDHGLYNLGDGHHILNNAYATPEQRNIAAAAPELLEALESYGDHGVGLATFTKRKNSAINKARGGE